MYQIKTSTDWLLRIFLVLLLLVIVVLAIAPSCRPQPQPQSVARGIGSACHARRVVSGANADSDTDPDCRRGTLAGRIHTGRRSRQGQGRRRRCRCRAIYRQYAANISTLSGTSTSTDGAAIPPEYRSRHCDRLESRTGGGARACPVGRTWYGADAGIGGHTKLYDARSRGVGLPTDCARRGRRRRGSR
jgi:hypothetical protein